MTDATMTWPMKPLGKVAKIERNSVTPENIRSGSLYVGLENITGTGSFDSVREVATGELASNKFSFTPNHVLYGKLRPYLSKIARPDFSGICSTDILPVLPGEEVDRDFLFYFLRQPEMVKHATARSTGANLPRLSPTQLAQFPVPLPTLEEQKRIAAILDKADAICRKRQEALRELDNLPSTLFCEWFGDPIMNSRNYPVVELRNVISLTGGFAFRSEDYQSQGIPLIRIGNANNGKFAEDSLVYLPEHYQKEFARYLLSPGDMIMTLTGTVGKDDYANIIKVPNDYDHWFLNQRVAKVTLTDECLSQQYLIQYLMTPHVKNLIRRMNRGVRQANLRNDDILSQRLPLPPLDRQTDFATAITQYEKLRTDMQLELRVSGALFQSLVQRAFKGEL